MTYYIFSGAEHYCCTPPTDFAGSSDDFDAAVAMAHNKFKKVFDTDLRSGWALVCDFEEKKTWMIGHAYGSANPESARRDIEMNNARDGDVLKRLKGWKYIILPRLVAEIATEIADEKSARAYDEDCVRAYFADGHEA